MCLSQRIKQHKSGRPSRSWTIPPVLREQEGSSRIHAHLKMWNVAAWCMSVWAQIHGSQLRRGRKETEKRSLLAKGTMSWLALLVGVPWVDEVSPTAAECSEGGAPCLKGFCTWGTPPKAGHVSPVL
ncbi:hypothetical protein GWK47_034143 [Chionoecetes opilio]|uniref:Uncharacterized protein n=1 Tax=Chionoecetes opilio TaxID=41210 RepID=A0A8J5CP93_CHIOP|nr:hypothetical protein GWK47_034143 [Chionoecetes opilio]